MVENPYICECCGGEVKPVEDQPGMGKCAYCRRLQPIPQLKNRDWDEKFRRAEECRKRNEFSDALEILKGLLNDQPNNAELNWYAALCTYGIEYTKDEYEDEYKPTIHRYSVKPFKDCMYYREAVKNSSGEMLKYYKDEGNKISEYLEEVEKQVENEKPFDVFISFKNKIKDENGKETAETQDTAYAYEIYNVLTERNEFKVFFSPETLGKKSVQEYEPIIYRALESSKIMILVGSRREYLESAWVKNEWTRYVEMEDEDKRQRKSPRDHNLCPAVFNGLPEEILPEVLYKKYARTQRIDTTSASWPEKLKASIRDIMSKFAPPAPVAVPSQSDGSDLTAIKEDQYNEACQKAEIAQKQVGERAVNNYKRAAEMLKKLGSFKDSRELAKKYERAANDAQMEMRYQETLEKESYIPHGNYTEMSRQYKLLASEMYDIGDYREAKESAEKYDRLSVEYAEKAEEEERKRIEHEKEINYDNAKRLMSEAAAKEKIGEDSLSLYYGAVSALENAGDFRDSVSLLDVCNGKISQIEKNGSWVRTIIAAAINLLLIGFILLPPTAKLLQSALGHFDILSQFQLIAAVTFVCGIVHGCICRKAKLRWLLIMVFIAGLLVLPLKSFLNNPQSVPGRTRKDNCVLLVPDGGHSQYRESLNGFGLKLDKLLEGASWSAGNGEDLVAVMGGEAFVLLGLMSTGLIEILFATFKKYRKRRLFGTVSALLICSAIMWIKKAYWFSESWFSEYFLNDGFLPDVLALAIAFGITVGYGAWCRKFKAWWPADVVFILAMISFNGNATMYYSKFLLIILMLIPFLVFYFHYNNKKGKKGR